MNFFNVDLKKTITGIVLIALTLFAINMQRKPEEVPWFLRPFAFVASVVQSGYESFSSQIRGTTGLYVNLIDIKKNNRSLLEENVQLRAELGRMSELRLENQRLNELLQFKNKSDMQLLSAKVIGRDLLPDHSSITVNRGDNDGVTQGMAAITVGGVAGYIVRVDRFSSQVLLLTDRYAAIDAIVQRSRARGTVQGKSKNQCELAYLQRDDDVARGDLIVTSGLDNVFPKGFPIGTVTAIKKSRYGVGQSVEIRPAINPTSLEEVFIVLNAHNEELARIEESSGH